MTIGDNPGAVYRSLGVKPAIAASGWVTAHGGSKLRPIGCFSPTSDLQNDHQRSVVVDVVDDSVGSNTKAPGPLLSSQFAYARWPRVLCQSLYGERESSLGSLR